MTIKNPHIHKAGGILIKDKKLLVERSVNKSFFIAPGGSVENGETPEKALERELWEEFSLRVTKDNFKFFGTFSAQAAGQPGKTVRMDVFMVTSWSGEPIPSSEVEEFRWIDSNIPPEIKVGSIFEHEVIPRLKQEGLID